MMLKRLTVILFPVALGLRSGGWLSSLSYNKLGDAGVQALAAALPSCAKLATLTYARSALPEVLHVDGRYDLRAVMYGSNTAG